MKKPVVLTLLLCLMLPLAAQAAEYISISELNANPPERFQKTYKTKWRTIEVDAGIRLPDTEAVPILKVDYPNREPENGWTEDAPGRTFFLHPSVEGWDEVESRPSSFILYNTERKIVPRKVDGQQINKNAEAAGQWYSGFAPENTYVPMCDITYGEICDIIRTELVRFGYDSQDYQLEMPDQLWAQHWYFYGYKKDALPGHIFLEATQKLHGLPYLSHIMQAVSNSNGESRVDEPSLLRAGISASYDGYDERLNSLFIRNVEIVETLAEDVPLCSIDQVIRAIEPMIEKGNIRKVYEITLGYVAYNEPGVYFKKKGNNPVVTDVPGFYLKPAWQVNCLYVKSATGKLRETASYTTDERNTLDYQQLLVDAQTGKLIEESRAQDRCEYKGFISWEDAGGKR
jgi:hypothetical protein